MIMTKRKKIIAAALAAAALLAGWRWTRKPDRGPAFREAVVDRGDIAVTVSATGMVQPRNRLEVKPPIGGRVEAVLVEEGVAVKRGQVLAWMSSTERAALLDAARAKGPAELAHWEGIYKPAPLLSPSDGVVIARNVEPGQTATAQDALLVVSDRLIVKAQVDETDIARVATGQEARITLDAYPDAPVPARVSHVAFEAKTVSNVTVYEIDVLPAHVPDFMRSGMTADVSFFVARKENVLRVPAEAVREGEGPPRVLVPAAGKKKDRPDRRAVKVGLSDGKMTEVLDGLSEGETVLIPAFDMPQAKGGGANPFLPNVRRGGGGGGRGR